ncbi:MAG: hypothetical protein WCI18_01115 [Pseudomonadota bacterium]
MKLLKKMELCARELQTFVASGASLRRIAADVKLIALGSGYYADPSAT